ncbi:hypothetical protein [Euzebya rosea]|uniref:hypothetical protein n=1 Tax=Euzebya rosea TaxID=2052804 RepID=UPI000D3E67E9|nr:hypothetical protein [Euzebya rosea]
MPPRPVQTVPAPVPAVPSAPLGGASRSAAGEIVVTTRSGSTYHVAGDLVLREHDDGYTETYTLIDLGDQRLRYTDGERVFVSSAVVSRRAA